jgi:dienelactone hydrolase
MKSTQIIRSALKYAVLVAVLAVALLLAWLRWDSHRPRDDWFGKRQGQIESVKTESSATQYGQLSESVQLTSDSGLHVSFRIIRDKGQVMPQPVLLILGGHRTGMDAVDLFGDVGSRTVVGVDYPYDGPDRAKGAISIAKTIPPARRAFLDTVPAVSLVLDWLFEQHWVDKNRVVIVGASLGVPFAAAVASHDSRVAGLILVHGAADNRVWAEAQVARRIDSEFLRYPLSTLIYWLAYGPIFDTGKYVSTVSPRPVLIIGARQDERTPAGQSELLFAAAGDPKRLRFTEGRHVQPNRKEIIAELLRITDEEITFLHEGGP